MTEPGGRPRRAPEGDTDATARMRGERQRTAEERSALRRARRRSDRQFMGLMLFCVVVFFAVGLLIAHATRPSVAPSDGLSPSGQPAPSPPEAASADAEAPTGPVSPAPPPPPAGGGVAPPRAAPR